MKIESPYKIKEIKFQRNYPGYIYRKEVIDDSEYGGAGNLLMVNCYSSDSGHWIGNSKEARFLCAKRGLRNIQKAHKKHCVCSIGFHESEQKWYGWSHRAICGFGIGDMIFKERYGDDNTPFVKHGNKPILTMEDAKKAAINFAASVS